MSWQRVRVQVGYQRYRYRVKMFCDVCGKQINWCVPPNDITSTEHVCEYCYSKIEQKLVTVNSVCCEKAVALVRKGDKITVRSKGKFIIESIDEKTKKGRLKISAKKYI